MEATECVYIVMSSPLDHQALKIMVRPWMEPSRTLDFFWNLNQDHHFAFKAADQRKNTNLVPE